MFSTRLLFAALITTLTDFALAECECGFLAQNPQDAEEKFFFSSFLETDFSGRTGSPNLTEWVVQEFNVSAESGRGEYGKAFATSNVEALWSPDGSASAPIDDSALVLRVNASLQNEAVPAAEIDSRRLDLHWGSYRAAIKATDTNGTCAAFFWYFNDTQEIDIEFLSREFDHDEGIYPVHLVIQSTESNEAGHDASRTDMYRRVNLTFDPTAEFHEYRFDYLPGRVLFYADSVLLAEMQGNDIPTVGGHIILQHWSNGNAQWSGGPPGTDALLAVSYVKAYFNSSDPEQQSLMAERCNATPASDESVCTIPDVMASEVASGGHFIQGQTPTGDNQNPGTETDDEQEGSQDEENAALPSAMGAPIVLVMSFLMGTVTFA